MFVFEFMENYGPYEDDDIDEMYSEDENKVDNSIQNGPASEMLEEGNNTSLNKKLNEYDESIESDLHDDNSGKDRAFGGRISGIWLILMVLLIMGSAIITNYYSFFSISVNTFLLSSFGIQGQQSPPNIYEVNNSQIPPNSFLLYTNNQSGYPQTVTIINSSCNNNYTSDCKSFNYSSFAKLHPQKNNFNQSKYLTYVDNYKNTQLFFSILWMIIMGIFIVESYLNLENRTRFNTYVFVISYSMIGFGILGVSGFVTLYGLYNILDSKGLIGNG